MSEPMRSSGGDLIDAVAGLEEGSAMHALRRRRAKVVLATQGSCDALFDSGLPGLSLVERLRVALSASMLAEAPGLAAHYRERLTAAAADPRLTATVQDPAGGTCAPTGVPGERLGAMLAFTRTLILNPSTADRAALEALPAAGLSTPAVVALAQLIAFLSFQVRLVAGLEAMKGAMRIQDEERVSARSRASTSSPASTPSPASTSSSSPASSPSKASSPSQAEFAPVRKPPAPGSIIRAHGFTSEPLQWLAWLDVVDLASATPDQVQVLEESHPQAKVSDYYRLLVHQPEILRQRSAAFNAIMYAPLGLSRAERELAATVTSRINGCVYCASVHAQRFEQTARRNDVILQVFQAPQSAGTSAREQAIVQFSIALTAASARLAPPDIRLLEAAGLDALEILDLIHAVAIFAWANRLMLNLGEPVYGDPGNGPSA